MSARYSRSQREEKTPEGKPKGRHHKTPQGSPLGFVPLTLSPFHHDVAVGNARESDDMDAATRRRFA